MDIEEARERLTEFREKGDKIDSSTAEYLISHGFVESIKVEVKSISALMEGRRGSYEINPHHIWTPLGREVYQKLSRHDSLPKIAKIII